MGLNLVSLSGIAKQRHIRGDVYHDHLPAGDVGWRFFVSKNLVRTLCIRRLGIAADFKLGMVKFRVYRCHVAWRSDARALVVLYGAGMDDYFFVLAAG